MEKSWEKKAKLNQLRKLFSNQTTEIVQGLEEVDFYSSKTFHPTFFLPPHSYS